MTHPPEEPYGPPPTRPFGAYEPGVYGTPAAPPPAPGVYGAPPSAGVYGAPPAYGTPPSHGSPPAYGAPPAYGSPPAYGAPAPAYGAPAPAKAPVYGTPPAARQEISPYSAPPAPATPYGNPVSGFPMPVPHQGHRLVPPGGRLGAALLDSLLVIVTFGIGWIIWALIVWSRGQSPGKQLLGHVVADVHTGLPFTWGQMFVRDFLIRGLLFWVLNVATAGIFGIVNACFVFADGHRTLHDRMAGSIVRYADI